MWEMADKIARVLWPDLFKDPVTRLAFAELTIVPPDEVAQMRDWARGEARKAIAVMQEPGAV